MFLPLRPQTVYLCAQHKLAIEAPVDIYRRGVDAHRPFSDPHELGTTTVFHQRFGTESLDDVLKFGEDSLPGGSIVFGFLGIAENDVAVAVEEHLFNFKIACHNLIVAPAGEDLLLDLLVLLKLAAQDISKG